MLKLYIQNKSVGMTVDKYHQMCEALGTTPKDEDIPLEGLDFPIEVQQAWSIYELLPSKYDGLSGEFQGKHLEEFITYANVLGITEDLSDLFKVAILINREELLEARSKQKPSNKK